MWTTCLECKAVVADEVAHALWHATLQAETKRTS